MLARPRPRGAARGRRRPPLGGGGRSRLIASSRSRVAVAPSSAAAAVTDGCGRGLGHRCGFYHSAGCSTVRHLCRLRNTGICWALAFWDGETSLLQHACEPCRHLAAQRPRLPRKRAVMLIFAKAGWTPSLKLRIIPWVHLHALDQATRFICFKASTAQYARTDILEFWASKAPPRCRRRAGARACIAGGQKCPPWTPAMARPRRKRRTIRRRRDLRSKSGMLYDSVSAARAQSFGEQSRRQHAKRCALSARERCAAAVTRTPARESATRPRKRATTNAIDARRSACGPGTSAPTPAPSAGTRSTSRP